MLEQYIFSDLENPIRTVEPVNGIKYFLSVLSDERARGPDPLSGRLLQGMTGHLGNDVSPPWRQTMDALPHLPPCPRMRALTLGKVCVGLGMTSFMGNDSQKSVFQVTENAGESNITSVIWRKKEFSKHCSKWNIFTKCLILTITVSCCFVMLYLRPIYEFSLRIWHSQSVRVQTCIYVN